MRKERQIPLRTRQNHPELIGVELVWDHAVVPVPLLGQKGACFQPGHHVLIGGQVLLLNGNAGNELAEIVAKILLRYVFGRSPAGGRMPGVSGIVHAPGRVEHLVITRGQVLPDKRLQTGKILPVAIIDKHLGPGNIRLVPQDVRKHRPVKERLQAQHQLRILPQPGKRQREILLLAPQRDRPKPNADAYV